MTTSMTLIPLNQPTIRRPRDRYITLVATLLLVLFIGALLRLNGTQMPAPLDPVPVEPAPQSIPAVLISKNNAASLHHIGQVGKGLATGAVWSPDGKRLIISSTAGLWIYDANDLNEPLENIYADLNVYAALVFSRDGRRMAFTSDRGIRIWDLVEMKDVSPDLKDLKHPPAVIDLSPDAHVLAVGDFEGIVDFYDTDSGALLSRHQVLEKALYDLSFNPDGTEIAFVGKGSSLLTLKDPTKTWDSEDLTPSALGSESDVGMQNLAYSPDGARLAARMTNTIIIWDAATHDEISRFNMAISTRSIANDFKGDIAFSPDGMQLVTMGAEVLVWDIATQTSDVLIEEVEMYESTGRIQFKPDWTQFLRVSSGAVSIKDFSTQDTVANIWNYWLKNFKEVSYSPDGTQIATWSDGRLQMLWTVSDLTEIRGFSPQEDIETMGYSYGVQSPAFHPTDHRFVAGYLDTGDIQIWNRADGTSADLWKSPAYREKETLGSGFIAYSADGTRLISKPPYASLVWVWDTAKGKVIRTIDMDEMYTLTSAALSPDGLTIAVALRSAYPGAWSSIAFYDIETGRQTQVFAGHAAEIRKLVYSPDGRFLASAAVDGTASLWDASTGEKVRDLIGGNGSLALAFSPDSQLLAGATNANPSSAMYYERDMYELNTLLVWDVASGDDAVTLIEDAPVQGLAFSPDGTRLVSALSNGTVQFWEVDSDQ